MAAGTFQPYRDTTLPHGGHMVDTYKAQYGTAPNIGAVYGSVGANLLITALDRAGKDFTADKLLAALKTLPATPTSLAAR